MDLNPESFRLVPFVNGVRHSGLTGVAVFALFLLGCGNASDSSKTATSASSQSAQQSRLTASVETETQKPLTAEEIARKKKIETQLAQEQPTHRIHFRSGRTLEGRLVSETPTEVRVRDGFGYSGYVVETYRRAEIASIDPLPATGFTLTTDDVRFNA